MQDWPHSPPHRFDEAGTYFITASTLRRQPIFTDPVSKDSLLECLFTNALEHDCSLQAWSLFSNHYHLVAHTSDGQRLHRMLSRFHTESAIAANHRDVTPGRKVWFQFRDTRLTYEKSWLARLRYTHENAVHHKLVSRADQYPWCSAGWFERTAPAAFVATVGRIKIDRLSIYDDF